MPISPRWLVTRIWLDQSKEALRAGVALLTLMGVVAAHYLAKPARDAYVTEYWGSFAAAYFSWIILLSAWVVARVVGGFFEAVGVRHLQTAGLVLTGAFYLAFPPLVKSFPLSATFSLWLVVRLFNLFSVAFAWSWVDSAFSPFQARRWYWLVGLGGPIGAVVGAVAGDRIATSSPTHRLLAAAAVVQALLIPLHLILCRWRRDDQPTAGRFLDLANEHESALRRKDLRIVWGFPYTRTLLLLVVVSTATFSTLRWVFLRVVELQGFHVEEYAHYFAAAYKRLSIIALVAELTLTPLALRLLPGGNVQLVMPLLIVVGACLAGLQPSAHLLSTVTVVLIALDYTLHRCARELLFVVVPMAIRFKARSYIDAAGAEIGVIVGSAAVIGMAWLEIAGTRSVVGILLLLGTLWLACAWRMRKWYSTLSEVRDAAE